MYEGAPNHPQPDRFWQIIDDHKVTVFYTAPTAIRAFIKWGDAASGEARSELAAAAGDGGRADQSRGVDLVSRGDWAGAVPDCGYVVADGDGSDHDFADSRSDCGEAGVGNAAIFRNCAGGCYKRGPAGAGGAGGAAGDPEARGLRWRERSGDDPDRYVKQYWSDVPGSYFTGDGARMDEDGYFWLMGRVDDVINVSGHRLGTMEVESALVAHPKVAEAAVVGRPDELKGQAIAAFVTLEGGFTPTKETEGRAAGAGWRRRLGRSRVRTIFGLRISCRRRGRGRLCGGCCGRWRRMGRSKAT